MTSDIQSTNLYRIQYQVKGSRAVRCEYTAPSVDKLLAMVWRSEGIKQGDLAHMYIHQVLSNGSVLEVVAHDEMSSNLTSEGSVDEGESLIDGVKNAISEAVKKAKPHLRLVTRTGKVVDGFDVVAYPAKSTDN